MEKKIHVSGTKVGKIHFQGSKMWENPCFKGRKSAPPKYDRPARRLPRAAAEANRAVDMLRTGGDLDAVMQLGSAGGRGARGGAKRI